MRYAICCLALCSVQLANAAQPVQRVIYPGDDFRYAEYVETLHMALEKTIASHGPYSLSPAVVPMNETRYLAEAKTGKHINVVWSGTSKAKERALLPIRIPLGKGILGYRVALIHQDSQPRLDKVTSIDDLKAFSFGLGPGWGDIAIYREAGFKIVTANYEHLFSMLARKRFDIFSRGINEVFQEHEKISPSLPEIAIEQNLLLHYTYPFYFFVSPAEPTLAARIEAGLRIMLKDGSFDDIFKKYNADVIRRANLSQRRIIEIPNPDLPDKTPLKDPSLWFKPRQMATSSIAARHSMQ